MPRPRKIFDRLAGKTAIVTGAGGVPTGDGIGMAIAQLFAAEGAHVVVVDSSQDRANYTQALIAATDGRASVFVADVSEEAACGQIIASAVELTGRVDILVNNAGIAGGGNRLEELDIIHWQRVFDVNLKGALLMTRAAQAALLKPGGVVLNIASVAALRVQGTSFAYGPSKAALINLTQELALVYGPAGLRVNAICPGHLYTPMVARMDAETRELRRRVAPLRLEGDAWDVAQAALYFASDEARFVTGACLAVDGGVTVTAALAALELAQRDC